MPKAQEGKPFEIDVEAKEFYIDSAHIATQLYSSILYLGKLREEDKPLVQIIIKMSPPMLKSLGLILTKHVREYERDIGPISLPKQLLHSLGLEELI